MDITGKNICKGIRLYSKRLLWPILHWYDITFKKELTVAVADLMLLRDGEIYNRQFYVAARLLDAKLYYEKGDASFPYQVAVSYNYNPKCNRAKRDKRFLDLLNSVQNEGYNFNCHVIIDKDMQLVDGSHRIALAIYNNITEVTVDCWYRKKIVYQGLEQWTASAINPQIFNNVLNEFERIQIYLLEKGQSFVLWISGSNEQEAQLLFDGLRPYVKYFNFYKFNKTTSSIQFEGLTIDDGFYAQFIPNKVQYKIIGTEYYSTYVKHLSEILTKKIKRLNYTQQFYISPNCLYGEKLFSLLEKLTI